LTGDGPLLVHRRIAETPWVLVFLSSSDAFYAPARRQASYVLLAFFGLTLIGIAITHLVMKPAAGGILVGTRALYDLLGRNRDLLKRARESESLLQSIIDNAPAVIYAKNLDGTYRLVNSAYEQSTGLSRKQITGRTDEELFPPELAQRFRASDLQVIEAGRALEVDERVPLEDGVHDFLSIRFPLANDARETYGVCGISTDITERKHREREQRLLAAVFESSEEAILITDAAARIVDVNPAFTRIMGFTREESIGRDPRLLNSGLQDRHFYDLMWQALSTQGSWRAEMCNKRKDGSLIPMLASITCLRDEQHEVSNYVAVYSDISAIKESEERLGHLAHHDALTDLPNRMMLDVRMEHAIERARRSGKQLGVIFLDLDHFKNVNDSLGHNAGDALLVEVAKLLRGAIRNSDTVARISGDEFVLLLEDIGHPDAVIRVLEKILQALDRPFMVSGQSIRVTASLGVSLFPNDGKDGNLLMRNADAAMYLAKSEGRNTYNFYTEELTRQAFERMQLESWLRGALDNEEFSLHYQPQVDLRTGAPCGLEALLRWTRADGTTIPPDRFIPVAEGSDLILPLGKWILHNACRQARRWLDQGLEFGKIAINVSGKQVSAGNLVSVLDEILQETALPSRYLELELTETFVMGEPHGAIDTLRQLRERGVTLTVDDFGTGYSSLAYLKSLPIQRLKIDRSFIRDIPADPNDMAITRAVIALGKSLQLEVVGEGIETESQLDFLRAEGCHLGQGYLYSRPLPADELLPLLQNQRRNVG
jgi:diguanylate cyclase (GGDEF)-like protein/PAS domain S-box-containing protein